MQRPDHPTAAEVSEMLLAKTGSALLANDFDAFALCFAVPHVIETPDKKTILKTTAALRNVFERVVQDYRDRNITELIRFCEVAEYRGPLKIEATHVTHMMSGNLRVMDPFPAYSILEFIDNRWQCTASQYAVDNKTTVGRALHTAMTEQGQPKPTDPASTPNRKEN